MFLLCFFLFYSPLFCQNRTAEQDKNWWVDEPCLKELRPHFSGHISATSVEGFLEEEHFTTFIIDGLTDHQP